MATRFRDRAAAGARLGAMLEDRAPDGSLVLGIPRGGIVVAAEVAVALDAVLAPICAVKIRSSPGSEFAIGAVAPDGEPLFTGVASRLGMTDEQVSLMLDEAVAEVRRRQAEYGPVPDVSSFPGVVVVDDGVATGSTLMAALAHVRRLEPEALICAVPVAPPDTAASLEEMVDLLVCPSKPVRFRAVGEFYDDFQQVPDGTVLALLGR